MNVDANAVIESLKAQRNTAQDEVALLNALVKMLQEEIKELRKKEKDSANADANADASPEV